MQLTKDNLLSCLPEHDEELKIKFGVIRKGGYEELFDYMVVPRMEKRFDELMTSLVVKGKVLKSGGFWMKPSDKPPTVEGKVRPQIGIHRMSAQELLKSFQDDRNES